MPRKSQPLRPRESRDLLPNGDVMSKPYMPTFEIVIRRKFDGKEEGCRSWKLTGVGSDIDKLEDAIAFLVNCAMDSIPSRAGTNPSPGKGRVLSANAEDAEDCSHEGGRDSNGHCSNCGHR